MGLLSDVTRIFRENNLTVTKAEVSTKDGKAYHFFTGDQLHPSWSEIYTKLEELVAQAKKEGYEPDTE
ncbi:hypothetical protein IEQ34_009486 [Dendrobium chrysotoxum]|uniref:ACT domain-containing protein n=1 Tax=Dendrobium chrysotoxum TaxID=161865 RepID=A0AAV7GYQ4_DENCH|nr:hypothetical protein IEQ34_009486 [Dendrobium chrysotoxum]